MHELKRYLLPVTILFVMLAVALFSQQSRDWILPILFLLSPFLDRDWKVSAVLWGKRSSVNWVILGVAIAVLLVRNLDVLNLFIVMGMVAALPEEWFFRAYLQTRLGNGIVAMLIVSLLFSLMHYITRDSMVAVLVFMPSIFFCWIYKKTNDIVLVVMLHALSNLVYYIYLEAYINELII